MPPLADTLGLVRSNTREHSAQQERGSFRSLVAMNGLFARLVREGGFTEPKTPEEEAREKAEEVDVTG